MVKWWECIGPATVYPRFTNGNSMRDSAFINLILFCAHIMLYRPQFICMHCACKQRDICVSKLQSIFPGQDSFSRKPSSSYIFAAMKYLYRKRVDYYRRIKIRNVLYLCITFEWKTEKIVKYYKDAQTRKKKGERKKRKKWRQTKKK